MTTFSATRRDALRSVLGLGAAAGAAACATTTRAATAPVAVRFDHGVASGDPLHDRVVIWTRVTLLEASPAPVEVSWRVATDDAFTEVVREGVVRTDAGRDYTVKVDVDGLSPGAKYVYQFTVGDTTSPLGRTRTAPQGATEQLVIASVSCSNFPFGFFHAYRNIAARGDIDLVLHMGDYIYEYGGEGSWGEETGRALGRAHLPPKEIVTLEDYRIRHAQYKSDPDLQLAHGAAPWVCAWDDHEITNNPWMDGAQNHQPETEGAWSARKAAAIQAYFEWMPAREPVPGRSREAFWRSFSWGDLASLTVFETRLTGRMEELDYRRDLPFVETPFDVSNPEAPVAILDPERAAALPAEQVRMVRTPFDLSTGTPRPILDWAAIQALDPANLPETIRFLPDAARFRAEILGDPDRTLISPEQERFVTETVAASVSAGQTWQILGSQILFARQDAPDLAKLWDEATKATIATRGGWVGQYIALSSFGLPTNLDAWDGYPAQRDRLSDAFAVADANIVVLAGDTHTFWANELYDTGDVRIGAEFGSTGVTSPSWVDLFEGAQPSILEAMAGANREIVWASGADNGYVLVTFTRDAATADFVAVSDIEAPDYAARVVKRVALAPRAPGASAAALRDLPTA